MSDFGPVNDNADRPLADRRREPRRRVLLTGKIVYPQNSFSADCTIRDISASGARISVNPEAISSDPFLIVVKDAVVHESHTAWLIAHQAGLRFLNSTDLGQEAPLQLRQIQRIWMELMPR
jgi:hypothetical protein